MVPSNEEAIRGRSPPRRHKALGYLTHIVGDVAQPMHTDSSEKEDGVDSSYEQAVDNRLGRYRFRYDGADGAKAGSRTCSVGRHAHRAYWALVNAYDAKGYTPRGRHSRRFA